MSCSEWREVNLSDITGVIIDYRGKTPKKLGGDWSHSGYRTLSAKNIKTGQIVQEESIRYVSKDLYEKWMKEEIRRGDILITSEAPFGQIYYWGSDERIVLGQRVFGVRVRNAHSKFVYYYMTSNMFQNELYNRATGTTVTGLRQPELLKCCLKLPYSLKLQEAIAATLSCLDDKIELNNRINKTLEEMAQAIFKSWFVDFEPFQDGEFVDSELGPIPKGWRVAMFGEVLADIEAGNRPKGGVGQLNTGIPSIGAENIIGLGVYDFSKEKYVSREYYDSMKKGIVKNWDVLLYKDGAKLGRKTIFAEDFPHKNCCINSHVFILRSNDLINQPYLYFWLDQKEMTQNIINLNANSAQPGINQASVRKLKILIPDTYTVSKFQEMVKPLMTKLFVNCKENQSLSTLRNSLLPKLMSGEVRVPIEEVQ